MSRQSYLAGWRARSMFWGGAVLVGLCAVGFANMTDVALDAHDAVMARWPLLGLALTPLILTAVAWLTRRVAPQSAGSGIPQVVAALKAGGEVRLPLLSLRIAAAKIGLTTLGLLGGASVGREGPTVHVGASIMDALGRWAGVPFHTVQRGLVLAGGAAGVAAAFNTPIAGIVFAVEELARSFEERSTGTVLTAVVIAGVVSTALLGNHVYFGRAAAHPWPSSGWIAVLLCGVIGGVAGGGFSRLLIAFNRRAAQRPSLLSLRTVFWIGCGVALLGWLSGGSSFGSGYSEARELLTSEQPQQWLFPLWKFLATLLSYCSGIPGGIFSPSLSTGAGLGADLGWLCPQVPAAAMIILGMAGYFTGVTQAPMTGAIIVMEMVDDHAMILPILATAFLASAVSSRICHVPVYQALAEPFLPPKPKAPDAAATPVTEPSS